MLDSCIIQSEDENMNASVNRVFRVIFASVSE